MVPHSLTDRKLCIQQNFLLFNKPSYLFANRFRLSAQRDSMLSRDFHFYCHRLVPIW